MVKLLGFSKIGRKKKHCRINFLLTTITHMMIPVVAENDGTDFREKCTKFWNWAKSNTCSNNTLQQVQSNAVLLQILCATHSFLGSSRTNSLCLYIGQINKQTGQIYIFSTYSGRNMYKNVIFMNTYILLYAASSTQSV